MTQQKQLLFNAFNMTTLSHNWAGLWDHPRDTIADYNRPPKGQLKAEELYTNAFNAFAKPD